MNELLNTKISSNETNMTVVFNDRINSLLEEGPFDEFDPPFPRPRAINDFFKQKI